MKTTLALIVTLLSTQVFASIHCQQVPNQSNNLPISASISLQENGQIAFNFWDSGDHSDYYRSSKKVVLGSGTKFGGIAEFNTATNQLVTEVAGSLAIDTALLSGGSSFGTMRLDMEQYGVAIYSCQTE